MCIPASDGNDVYYFLNPLYVMSFSLLSQMGEMQNLHCMLQRVVSSIWMEDGADNSRVLLKALL